MELLAPPSTGESAFFLRRREAVMTLAWIAQNTFSSTLSHRQMVMSYITRVANGFSATPKNYP